MFRVSPGPPLRSETVSLSTSPAKTTLASTASRESVAHNSGMWQIAPDMLVVPVAIGSPYIGSTPASRHFLRCSEVAVVFWGPVGRPPLACDGAVFGPPVERVVA